MFILFILSTIAELLQNNFMEKLGLIAGNGRFPILFAKGARDNKVPIIAVGIFNETSPEIEQYVDKLYWVGVAQIGKLIKIFKDEHITKAVMARRTHENQHVFFLEKPAIPAGLENNQSLV